MAVMPGVASRRVSVRGIGAAVAVLIVAAVCIRLGFWQLDRLEQRRADNAAIARALALPPIELNAEGVAALQQDPEKYLYRRAVASGNYDEESEILLRGRAHAGSPGVHLVAPLRLSRDDAIVLVNRGWLPSPDAATVDPRPFRATGPRTVDGILQTVPAAVDAAFVTIDVEGHPVSTYRRLDYATLAGRLDGLLLPLYLQELPAASPASLPAPVPPPTLSEGSHLSYAVQWFSFAAIAVIGFAVVFFRPPSRVARSTRPDRHE